MTEVNTFLETFSRNLDISLEVIAAIIRVNQGFQGAQSFVVSLFLPGEFL